jgi:hypothetical protein
MSKVKDPSQEKALSLKRDRRNVYRENPAASRKGIVRAKRRSHKDERRRVQQALQVLSGVVEDDAATAAEMKAKSHIGKMKRRAFRKVPDQPLGVLIARKKTARAKKKTLSWGSQS